MPQSGFTRSASFSWNRRGWPSQEPCRDANLPIWWQINLCIPLFLLCTPRKYQSYTYDMDSYAVRSVGPLDDSLQLRCFLILLVAVIKHFNSSFQRSTAFNSSCAVTPHTPVLVRRSNDGSDETLPSRQLGSPLHTGTISALQTMVVTLWATVSSAIVAALHKWFNNCTINPFTCKSLIFIADALHSRCPVCLYIGSSNQ